MRFESNVNSDSIQTIELSEKGGNMFESNVNSDSIQTKKDTLKCLSMFESNVNSDSIQTSCFRINQLNSLRVM